MANKNEHLHQAKKKKNDEFYTRLVDIEKELAHYKDQLEGKWVYSPCDDYRWSNFTKYFVDNFHSLGLSHYTCTNYDLGDGAYRFDYDGENTTITQLEGNGDFASEECRQIMKECDIVVTNPPFSLFRPFVAQIMELGKKFLIIGNQNAITCKDIFPFIKDNKMWIGFIFNKTVDFIIPSSYEKYDRIDENGNKIAKVPAITWFTNLVHNKRLDGIYCPTRYKGREDKYPVYDNYDAIEIGHYTRNGKWEGSLDELPSDYDGVMGVPITFLGQYSPEQFEILQLCASHGKEVRNIPNESCHFNGRWCYPRILIRRKK